jgi:hypothetical protein
MRIIDTHKVNPVNDQLELTVLDEPGIGGACHKYAVTITDPKAHFFTHGFSFQNGPIGEVGVNGLTHEVLIAILIDRLEGFQSGQYACHENRRALDALYEAQLWLHNRTQARIERGVEGTHEK